MVALHSPAPIRTFRRQARAPTARKAIVRARRSDGLAFEWKPIAVLDTADWGRVRDLIGRTLQPNVFYEPAFMQAAANLPMAAGVSALLVRSGARLIGLLAGRVEGFAHGRPVPTFVAWELPYAPLSTPLLDREVADAAVGALLHELPRLPGTPQLALFRLIDEGPVARVLADRLYCDMKRPRVIEAHARAAFVPDPGAPRGAVSAKKHKEYGRLRRRLAELGTLERETARGEVKAAVAAFLALEASGWKGRAGTAASDDPAVARFLTAAVTNLAREGKAQVHLLKLDGKPIAAAIVLFSGDRAWFWKTAYDEAYAHFSPGVLNTLDLTAALGRDPRLALVDSCAVAPHPMIDRLWSGQLAVADWLVPLGGSGPLMLGLAAEKLRRAAASPLRALRDRLRG
jgi:hypothetical protein